VQGRAVKAKEREGGEGTTPHINPEKGAA
jgi:hypothetical protein